MYTSIPNVSLHSKRKGKCQWICMLPLPLFPWKSSYFSNINKTIHRDLLVTTRITQVVKDILLRILDCVGTWRLCALAASSKAHNQWWTSVGEYTSGHLERKQAFKLLNFLWDQPSCSCLYHCLLLCPLSLLPLPFPGVPFQTNWLEYGSTANVRWVEIMWQNNDWTYFLC